jgi:hypothetical protein
VGTCVLATAMFPLWRLFCSLPPSGQASYRVTPVSEENIRVDTGDRLHRGDGPPSERPARGDAGQDTPGRGAAGRANPQHAPHIDDEDAFLVEIGPAHDRTSEQRARAILEDAPILVRHALRWGWFVLGWEVRRSTPDVALLLPAPASAAGRTALQAPAAHAALRHLRATREPDPTRGMGPGRARASTGRAAPPRAGRPQDS